MILCTLRHFNEDQGKTLLTLYANTPIKRCGIDLAGDEANFQLTAYFCVQTCRLV